MFRSILLSFFLTLLLVLPAAGQALGLGELIWLRRVSEKKAARMLKAKGWELKTNASPDSEGFAKQTWGLAQSSDSTDSTRLRLEMYRGKRRADDWIFYWFGTSANEPAQEEGKYSDHSKRLAYFAPSVLSGKGKKKTIKLKSTSSAMFGSGGCSFYEHYIDDENSVTVADGWYTIWKTASKFNHHLGT